VRHIDMPCTAERVWQAIQDARAGRLPDPWQEPPAAMATLAVPGAGTAEEIEEEVEEVHL
jgi:aerobic carbon-monoxide dehydrogenase large subunit